MPLAAILGLAAAFCQLVKTILEKTLPDAKVPTFRKWAGKAINPPIEVLAKMERKRQEKLLRMKR